MVHRLEKDDGQGEILVRLVIRRMKDRSSRARVTIGLSAVGGEIDANSNMNIVGGPGSGNLEAGAKRA